MSQAAPTAELNTKPAAPTEWLVGKSGEVPERGRLVVDAGGKTIGIYRLDGVLYAYENICVWVKRVAVSEKHGEVYVTL